MWRISHRADPFACDIADRHYNRQKPGSPQCAPPGRCLVLTVENKGRAFWITSWPFGQYVRHRWPGAFVCSAFRNEGAGRASDLIRDAVAATRAFFGDPPSRGMITFIDRRKVRPTIVRGRKVWGWTWRRVGFEEVGETQGGLLALQLPPEKFPDAEPPHGMKTVHRHAIFFKDAECAALIG